MEKTKYYELFKPHPSNRPLDEANVVRIMKSVQQKNLLEYRPVLVDEEMRVIDGNHRVEVCKRLKIEVPYQVQKSAVAKDIFLLNQNQKGWGRQDYLHFYSSEGNADYTQMITFMKENNFSLGNALVVLLGRGKAKDSGIFKAGRFKFPSSEEMKDVRAKLLSMKIVTDFIHSKYLGNKIFLKSTGYLNALSCFLNIEGVEVSLLVQKLGMRLDLMRPCTKEGDYMNIFKTVYNFRNRQPVKVEEPPKPVEKEEEAQLLLHI